MYTIKRNDIDKTYASDVSKNRICEENRTILDRDKSINVTEEEEKT